MIPGRADRGQARSFHNPFQSGCVEHTNATFSSCKTSTKKAGRGGQGGLGKSPELSGGSSLLLHGFSRTSLAPNCEGEHSSQLPSPSGPTQLGSPLLDLQSAISGVPHFPDGPGTRCCSPDAEADCGTGEPEQFKQPRVLMWRWCMETKWREAPEPISSPNHTGLLVLPSQPQGRREADLVLEPLELLGLLELERISSMLGRTKPARFRRSRIIWPLMLMSRGELEWRLQGKNATQGQSSTPG